MDDRADLSDGLVDGREGGVDEGLDGCGVGLPLCNFLLGGVQGHAGREELLDGEVVEVAADAVALVEERGDVLGVAGGGELEGERRLRGKRFGE